MPPVSLHGKEAAADQAEDKRGVSVNMQSLVGPGLDHFDGSTELSDVIRQTRAYKMEDCRETAGGEPSSTCSAMGVAIVEGRAVCPDMLPVGWYPTQAG